MTLRELKAKKKLAKLKAKRKMVSESKKKPLRKSKSDKELFLENKELKKEIRLLEENKKLKKQLKSLTSPNKKSILKSNRIKNRKLVREEDMIENFDIDGNVSFDSDLSQMWFDDSIVRGEDYGVKSGGQYNEPFYIYTNHGNINPDDLDLSMQFSKNENFDLTDKAEFIQDSFIYDVTDVGGYSGSSAYLGGDIYDEFDTIIQGEDDEFNEDELNKYIISKGEKFVNSMYDRMYDFVIDYAVDQYIEYDEDADADDIAYQFSALVPLSSQNEVIETRGYSQGDYAQVIIPVKELAKVWGRPEEKVMDGMQTEIDHLFWDAPIYARVEINGEEFDYIDIVVGADYYDSWDGRNHKPAYDKQLFIDAIIKSVISMNATGKYDWNVDILKMSWEIIYLMSQNMIINK